MATDRPNILLISTDQQRADHLGCYGEPLLRTPNLDSLAACGTRFERAYVAAPVCMPNRASLLTGRMPSLHGVRHNGLNLSPENRTFAEVLRDAGYRTSLSGKAHFQCVTDNPAKLKGDAQNTARRPGRARFDQERASLWRDDPAHELDLPYYGFEHVDLAVGHGDQVDGHYNRWVAQQGADLSRLRGPTNAMDGDACPLFQAWRTSVPEELYPTSYIGSMTEAAIERFAAEPDTPFFHWASFTDPHHPFTPPGRYWDMYRPEDVRLPASFAACDSSDWTQAVHRLRQREEADLGGTAAVAVTEAELRWATALTFGLISMVDHAIGGILSMLDRTGLADRTIVIFLSDHGDLMGDHGMIFKGPLHYQSVVRIPLIWYDPRHPSPPVRDDLISSVDVPATILEAAGQQPYLGMNGRAFVTDTGDPVAVRDAVLIEDEIQSNVPGTDIRGRARTLVTDRWRLTVHDGIDNGELFDLRDDPTESTNLWNDPTAQAVRSELTERLLREMIACSETARVPEFAA